MSIDYIIAGNVMIDDIQLEDGFTNKIQLGGPAIFAYTGVKLWTDNCRLLCNVGMDFYDYFSEWIENNDVVTDSINVVTEKTNHNKLVYLDSGDYTYSSGETKQEEHNRMVELGYMKIRPEQIGELTRKNEVKGLYLAQNSDYIFWEKLGEIKKRDKFKIMWEVEINACTPKRMPQLEHALQFVDIFSINIFEASKLFETKNEEKILESLQRLDVDYTLFRVGERGLYTVSKDNIHFHPSIKTTGIVDPTGSGNNSTGSALFAYTEDYDSIMIGTMANVASSINLEYYGAIKNMSARRTEALRIRDDVFRSFKDKMEE